MSQLEPPLEQYLKGDLPSHSSRQNLAEFYSSINQTMIDKVLKNKGYISEVGKPTKKSVEDGLVDTCEGKVLWNVENVYQLLVKVGLKIEVLEKRTKKVVDGPKKVVSNEPRWSDLGAVGTYFGVSNIVVGKWLDKLGLREKPKLKVNESGSVDMLDMARMKQQEQIDGFIGKQPTEKAINMGLARKLTVTNSKKKEIEITQWNVDLCKVLLVKAGHELNPEALLKGKGKNGDVKVEASGMDKRALELYRQLQKTGDYGIFRKQPSAIIQRVNKLLGSEGLIEEKLRGY